jgi:hypothetical protein
LHGGTDEQSGKSMTSHANTGVSHRDRMRRIVIVCCAFARNIAFYRAGWHEKARLFLLEQHPEAVFWRQVNGNFLDIAVLDWCKLFGDPKGTSRNRLGKHHWRRTVSDPNGFEAGLLDHLQMDEAGLGVLIGRIREYRDKFLTHLDNDLLMNIPELEPAYEAVAFYHRHIVEREAVPGELAGLPDANEFALGYSRCFDAAMRIYASHTG